MCAIKVSKDQAGAEQVASRPQAVGCQRPLSGELILEDQPVYVNLMRVSSTLYSRTAYKFSKETASCVL